jgi:hypothetical protein
VQQLGGDGIEEGLGQFGLVVIGQQADVVQLGLLPGVCRKGRDVEPLPQSLHGLVDALVVVLDALGLGPLLAMPVGKLEAALGGGAGFAEQPIVPVEAVDQRLGDVEGAAVGEFVREHLDDRRFRQGGSR